MITFLGIMFILIEKGTGERIAYLQTILLTETMFLVMVSTLVPVSREIPYICYLFLSYVILLSVLTLFVLALEKIFNDLIVLKDDEDEIETSSEKD